MADLERLSGEKRPWRIAAFLLFAVAGCATDLISKYLAFSRLGTPPNGSIYWLWENYFAIENSINRGALFGFGQGWVLFFAVVSVGAAGAILVWVFRGTATDDWGVTLALGGILGGVLGNLYDRLGLWGQVGVRDWIRVCYYDHVWPNFNIADSLLVCGAAFLVWHAFRTPQEAPVRESSGREPSARLMAGSRTS